MGTTVKASAAAIISDEASRGMHLKISPPKYMIIICIIATALIIKMKALFPAICDNIFGLVVRALNELNIPQNISKAKNAVKKYVSLFPSNKLRIIGLVIKNKQSPRL